MSIYKIKSLQASPDHLMDHLVQEHSAVDPTFVEDFLLCYRIFLKSPMELAYRLQTWFNTSTLRNKVSIHLVRCCYKVLYPHSFGEAGGNLSVLIKFNIT